MADSDSWKEKYLDALDEQERMEKTFEQQSELLKRAVVRVTLTAEGLDQDLDRLLDSIREAARAEKFERIERVMEDLDDAILDYDREREERQQRNRQALLDLLEGIAPTSDSHYRELRQELKSSGMTPMDLNTHLEALAGLSSEHTAKVDRLEDQSPSSPEEAPAAASEQAAISDEPLAGPLEGQIQTKHEVAQESVHQTRQGKPVHEPAFSRVSDKLYHVLKDLLDQVEPPEDAQSKAVSARQRLDRGLTWYELVPTLEDIRDLVLLAYLAADDEYREYLLAIDQTLKGILSQLGIASGGLKTLIGAERQYESELTEHLGSLSQTLEITTEVDVLKARVGEQLQKIETALKAKSNRTDQLEGLTAELEQVTQKLKIAEKTAVDTRAQLEQQTKKALTDTLTGLPNREAYNQRLHHEHKRWQRYGQPLCLAVCDIDHFKKLNDSYGHQTGDRVLQVLAKGLQKRLREIDFVGRYGGEEFVFILPNTAEEDAYALLDKVRKAIAGTPFRFKDEPVSVTLSMGVVGFAEGDTPEAAFARADELLYKAKSQGRNCCVRA